MTTTTWLRIAHQTATKQGSKRINPRRIRKTGSSLIQKQQACRRHFNQSANQSAVLATQATDDSGSPLNNATAAAIVSSLLFALGVSSSTDYDSKQSDEMSDQRLVQQRHHHHNEDNKQQWNHPMASNGSTIPHHVDGESLKSWVPLSTLPRILQPSMCSCDGSAETQLQQPLQQQHQPRNSTKNPKKQHRRSPRTSFLQRYRTIRRMAMHSTNQSLETRYKWNKSEVLGKGAFGDVYLAYDKLTPKPHEKVALKKISKVHTDDESFQREMRALLHVRDNGGHPHVCALRENYDEQEYYYLILDYIEGGEMFDHLINNGAYSERDAARLVREVADSLSFCHGIGLVHADLKPENILLSTSRRGDSVVKLADFGCSQVLEGDDISFNGHEDEGNVDGVQKRSLLPRKRSIPQPSYECPTPAYCPPELLNRELPIGPTMDVWALGVILYIMLTGAHPFDLEGNASDELIVKRIQDKHHPMPIRNSGMTAHLSDSAIDLIEKLMDRDPTKRLTAYEMLQHPWVRGETATSDIIAGSDQKLSKFRVFKSRIQAKFFQDAVNWSDRDVETLRKTSLIERSFQSLDTDLDGYLDINDLGQLQKDNPDGTPKSSPSPSSPHEIEDGISDDDDVVNVDEIRGPTLTMSDFQHFLS